MPLLVRSIKIIPQRSLQHHLLMGAFFFRRFSLDFITLVGCQICATTHPKDQLPDLLRAVMLSELWHPGKGHTVGNDEVNFGVRYLLGRPNNRADRGQPRNDLLHRHQGHGTRRNARSSLCDRSLSYPV